MTEALARQIEVLVAERQRLRLEGASREELERNRLAIGRFQRELARALLAQRPPGRLEVAPQPS